MQWLLETGIPLLWTVNHMDRGDLVDDLLTNGNEAVFVRVRVPSILIFGSANILLTGRKNTRKNGTKSHKTR